MPGYFIATFQMYAREFSNVTQGISLQLFKCRPGYFQMYPRVFHCDFSNACQGISLQLFKCRLRAISLQHFSNASARVFHCNISNVGQGISLPFFKCMPGYFIATFQM
jgi:hypothetical protein